MVTVPIKVGIVANAPYSTQSKYKRSSAGTIFRRQREHCTPASMKTRIHNRIRKAYEPL